jgi:DHA2 family methylenomycin A resistance protein-like MFS transporter
MLLAMTLGFVVVQLDVTVVNVATKTIGASVGGSISVLQWVVNAYTLSFAATILTAGALGDRVGAKRVFIVGFALFTVASLGCGLSPSLAFLIAARTLQGFGAAILVPCSLVLLNHSYDNDQERSRAVGIWASGASVAIAVGPIVGGVLIHLLGWRSIFYINVPIGALGIWLSWRYARETPAARNRSLDIPGQVTAMLALGLLAAALILGGKQGWDSGVVIGGFVCFAFFLTLFLLIESKISQPMLPLNLFRNGVFSATSMLGLFLNISAYGFLFILSLYWQQLRGYSPLMTGLCFLPWMCAVFPANLLAPKVAEKTGVRWTIVIGEAIFLAGCVFLLRLEEKTPFASMVAPLVAIGAGLGLVVPPMTTAMLGSVDKRQSGIASGVLNSMRQTGSVVGVALFGSLISGKNHLLQGLHLSLVITVAMAGLSIGAAIWGIRDK